ncbi:MAG: hypothetical protein RH946_16610 [Rhodospirillales bacterium]
MPTGSSSILLIGEYDVGKTVYGAQLLRRLLTKQGKLRMHGLASNLQPFEAALHKLSDGLLPDHTPTATFSESVWPVADSEENRAELIWPDYGGEQVSTMLESRLIPSEWKNRVFSCNAWLVMIRPSQVFVRDDILTKSAVEGASAFSRRNADFAKQAQLVELLQTLIFFWRISENRHAALPPLAIILSCWDELSNDDTPQDVLRNHAPLLDQFLAANYLDSSLAIYGVSSLSRALDKKEPDPEFSAKGPENFGYAIMPNGERTSDLSAPLYFLMDRRE